MVYGLFRVPGVVLGVLGGGIERERDKSIQECRLIRRRKNYWNKNFYNFL